MTKIVFEKKSHKKSLALGIIIILLGAGLIFAIFSYARDIQEPRLFVLNNRSLAERMYNEIMEYDYFAPGPDDAETILKINNDINLMFYGDMLVDDTLLGSLVEKQRLLYAPRLLETVSYTEQLDNLKRGLAAFKEQGTVCYDISTQPPRRHPDYDDIIIARVIWQTNNMGDITWEYALEEDENERLRILRFEVIG